MAASRSIRRTNPVAGRMNYVASRFNDYVTMATFGAWTEATGQHGLRAHIGRMFYSLRDPSGHATYFFGREGRDGHFPRFLRDHGGPPHTRFDRYLPWVAREFNRMYRPYRRMAKKLGLPKYPGGYRVALAATGHLKYGGDQSRQEVHDTVYGLMRTAWASRKGPDHLDLLRPEVQVILLELTEATLALQNRFRAIADWADQTGVDINLFDWKQAAQEAQEWGATVGCPVEQADVVFTFPDGWTVQVLRSESELEDEGAAMQHCVAEYAEDVADDGPISIYSLRDPDGRPHATLEWDEECGGVTQLRGKQNVAPKLKYLLRMVDFRIAVLDEHAKVRFLEHYPWDEAHFSTDGLIGVWAFNRLGKLRDKIGCFGALEEAMKNDVLAAVYVPDYAEEWVYRLHVEDPDDQTPPLLQDRLGDCEDMPGLEWAVWRQTGRFPASFSDEMVEALAREGVSPSTIEA